MKRCLAFVAVCLLASLNASAQDENEYVRFELLGPETSSFRVTLEVTATRAGSTHFGFTTKAQVANATAIDLATGESLKMEQKSGSMSAYFRKPVPEGGETRIRVQATYTNPSSYFKEGDVLVFRRTDLMPRNTVVLPGGYEIV